MTLNNAQAHFLRSNGIEYVRVGRTDYFYKSDRWLMTTDADDTIWFMEYSTHQDGDGERCIDTFTDLKRAIRALLSN